MAIPSVLFYKYSANNKFYTEYRSGSGAVATLPAISAGSWGKKVAFKIRFRSTDGNNIALSNVRLWFNRQFAVYKASPNDPVGTQVDIGNSYTSNISTASAKFWTMRYIYTAQNGLSINSIQQLSLSATCPAIALTSGDAYMGPPGTFGVLAAPFRGENAGNGVDLQFSAGLAAKSLYSKHIGLSFRPNNSALHGSYTNIGIQVTYDFN